MRTKRQALAVFIRLISALGVSVITYGCTLGQFSTPTLTPTSTPTLTSTSTPTLTPTSMPTLIPTVTPFSTNDITVYNINDIMRKIAAKCDRSSSSWSADQAFNAFTPHTPEGVGEYEMGVSQYNSFSSEIMPCWYGHGYFNTNEVFFVYFDFQKKPVTLRYVQSYIQK